MSKPPRVRARGSTARLAASSAGCAFSVSVSSLSGPSNISRDRCCDRASSTSSNSWRAGAKRLGQRLAHAGRLRSLAGKDKSPFHVRCILASQSRSARHSPPRAAVKRLTRACHTGDTARSGALHLFAEAQIVAFVFVILDDLKQDAVARQRGPRLLDFSQGGVVIGDRLRAFGRAAAARCDSGTASAAAKPSPALDRIAPPPAQRRKIPPSGARCRAKGARSSRIGG